MAKKLIIANWKMNPESVKEADALYVNSVKIASMFPGVSVVVAPPLVFMRGLAKGPDNFSLAGQDAFWAGIGSYTGEVSATMLASVGAKYVILGHSERRALGESDEAIAQKLLFSLKAGLIPILCVGEKVRDAEGAYLKELGQQLATSLAKVPKKIAGKVVVAYEPVWAIGKNATRAAEPHDVLEMSIYIRRILMNLVGAEAAKAITLVYGGSVDAKNAEGFLSTGGVAGLLVGRDSLNQKSFEKIVAAAAH